uniref:Lig_chan-Glu_bd domain-containing protein n=1 Tax=Steinernema glaseri TaxID=37863 RepID=A0A1I7XYK6_9BILA
MDQAESQYHAGRLHLRCHKMTKGLSSSPLLSRAAPIAYPFCRFFSLHGAGRLLRAETHQGRLPGSGDGRRPLLPPGRHREVSKTRGRSRTHPPHLPHAGRRLRNRAFVSTTVTRSVKVDVEREYGVRNELGSRDENGSWTGMMGLLIDGSVDVSGLSMRIAPEREEFVLFSYPTRYFQTVYILKRPETREKRKFVLMSLAPSLWLLFGVVVVLVMLLNLFFRLLNVGPERKTIVWREVVHATWDVVSVNLRQSASLPHSPLALFLLNGAFVVSCIVLVTFFQSEMDARMLAHSRFKIPFENQEQLVDALQREEVFLSGYSSQPALCNSPKVCHRLAEVLKKHPIRVRRSEEEVVADIAQNGVYQSTMDTAFIPSHLSWFSRKRDKIIVRDDLAVAHFASFGFSKRLRRLRDRLDDRAAGRETHHSGTRLSHTQGHLHTYRIGHYDPSKPPGAPPSSLRHLRCRDLRLRRCIAH